MTSDEHEDLKLSPDNRTYFIRERRAADIKRDIHTRKFGFFDKNSDFNAPSEMSPADIKGLGQMLLSFQQSADLDHVSYRGSAQCRVCGWRNGHRTYVLKLSNGSAYAWPEGYAHYLIEHKVDPDLNLLLMFKECTVVPRVVYENS